MTHVTFTHLALRRLLDTVPGVGHVQGVGHLGEVEQGQGGGDQTTRVRHVSALVDTCQHRQLSQDLAKSDLD